MKSPTWPVQNEFMNFDNLVRLCLFVVVFGCLLRLFEITQNSFIFYDEGMYLRYNAELLEKIQQYPPKNFSDLFAIARILFFSALTTAKWLWFLISNLRVAFGGPEVYYFTRVISAFSGIATIWMTYKLALKLFRSREIAYLSCAILAVLPSHVFYSRLSMQEAFSTLSFLSGIYFYATGRKSFDRLTASIVFLSAVYFTNYRMIILPALLFVFEAMMSLSERRKINWIKLVAVSGGFVAMVLFFGLLNKGSNLFITSAWMGKQAEMASQQWHWWNLLSYPFEIFSLEGPIFFLVCLASVYFVLKRDWLKVLPLAIVCAQIAVFTFASEKGARYLCVVLPFMAITAAVVLWTLLSQKDWMKVWAPPVLILLFFIALTAKSVAIVATPQGYQKAVSFIQQRDPNAKILTSQPLLVGLFTDNSQEPISVPKSFEELLLRYSQGYRYLILDPQAYVSWTQSQARFTLPLVDYLGFVSDRVPPIAKFAQLTPALLQRFVWDHNEDIKASLNFLTQSKKDFGAVYVYDLSVTIKLMQKVIETLNAQRGSVS